MNVGQLAWFPLTRNYEDISKHGVDGTPIAGAFLSPAFSIGGGVVLNGSTQYVQAPSIPIAAGGAVTMSAWVFSNNYAQSGFIFAKEPVNTMWEIFFEVPGTVILRGGGTTSVIAGVPSNGTFAHVAGTISGTAGTVYINGVSAASGAVDAIGAGTGLTDIGSFGTGYFFTGMIGNVRLWNRMLSDAEIAELYGNPWAGLRPMVTRTYSFISAGAFSGLFSDTIASADSITEITLANATLSDNSTLTEVSASQMTAIGAFADISANADSIFASLLASGAVSDSVATSESSTSILLVSGSFSDAGTLSEVLSGFPVMLAAFSDNVTTSDIVAATLGVFAFSFTDTIATSDVIDVSYQVLASLSDTASTADALVAAMLAANAFTDNVSPIDLTIGQAAMIARLADTLAELDIYGGAHAIIFARRWVTMNKSLRNVVLPPD